MRYLIVIILLFIPSCSYAAYPPEVNCIVGEASGEGVVGMVAVAQALANRKTMKGVYGCHAEHIKTENKIIFLEASDIWNGVLSGELNGKHDLVKGANSWGSISDINKNHMNEECIETARVYNHIFFKC